MNQQLNLNVDPDKIDAKYCDQALINTAPFGFTFDFIQQIPQMKTARILARIGMSPEHAKIFVEVLNNNIKQYENAFGEIKLTTRLKDEAARQIGFKAPEENNAKK